jgi:hypothetical protein
MEDCFARLINHDGISCLLHTPPREDDISPQDVHTYSQAPHVVHVHVPQCQLAMHDATHAEDDMTMLVFMVSNQSNQRVVELQRQLNEKNQEVATITESRNVALNQISTLKKHAAQLQSFKKNISNMLQVLITRPVAVCP